MTVLSVGSSVPVDRQRFDRRLFRTAAILFPLIVLIGFAPTYYLAPVFAARPLSSWVVHVHGLLMTTWVVLFVVQVQLIAAKSVRLHRQLGYGAIGLAVLIVCAGGVTALRAAKYGATTPSPPGIPPLGFLIIPLTDLVMFVLLFGAAVYYRRRPRAHKALMLLTAINFVPPAIARIQLGTLQALGPLWFFGFPSLLALTCVGLEWRHHRTLNRAFLAGTLALIASYVVRLALMPTAAWMHTAAWLTQFV